MPGPIDPARRKLYHELRYGLKLGQHESANSANVSRSWAYSEDARVKTGKQQNLGEGGKLRELKANKTRRADEVRLAASDLPAIPLEHLGADAQRQLEDFHYFCAVQFGTVVTPWRRAAFERVWRLWESPEKEYVVVNAPPGIGKSKLFTHDIPAFITVRDRRVRGLIGSATQKLANRYVRRLRTSFERHYPLEARESDLRLALAVDGKETLIGTFGRFRSPEMGQLWQGDQFEVELPHGFDTGEKEPTWQSYGRDAEQLGNRVDFVTWDDLVTKKTLNATRDESFIEWFTDEAETRLDPGGLFNLQGQRIDGQDLFRHRIDAETIDFDETGREVRGRKYHHFIFPAHIKANCKGDHSRDAEPATFDYDTGEPIEGSGCLLDPRRQTWAELSGIQAKDPRKFAILYQQEDVSEGTKLISRLWVHGGESVEGEIHPGCLDFERSIMEVPTHLHGKAVTSAASVDPSASNKWAVEWWLNEREHDIDHLMDIYKGELTAGELLGYNILTGSFYGIMDEWQIRSEKMGRRITHWIVEANVQQKFLLQHDFVHQWARRHNVTLVAHMTHSHNKQDKDLGFWAMRNQWRLGKIRLPYAEGSEWKSDILVNEGLLWPTKGMSDDALMAYWMYRIKLPTVVSGQEDVVRATAPAPSWLR